MANNKFEKLILDLKKGFDSKSKEQMFILFTQSEKVVVMELEKVLAERYGIQKGTAIAAACAMLLEGLNGDGKSV